jgi:hypothetical protein
MISSLAAGPKTFAEAIDVIEKPTSSCWPARLSRRREKMTQVPHPRAPDAVWRSIIASATAEEVAPNGRARGVSRIFRCIKQDAARASAARFVIAQPTIDRRSLNLNASTHAKRVTDLFLLDEALKISGI